MAVKKRFKRFTSIQEDIVFELHGEEFVCFPELDYRRYRQLVEDLKENTEGDDGIISSVESMIKSVEDRAKFKAILDDDNLITPLSTLSAIWTYLLTEYKVLAEDNTDPKS